jgi:hypothetical protein
MRPACSLLAPCQTNASPGNPRTAAIGRRGGVAYSVGRRRVPGRRGVVRSSRPAPARSGTARASCIGYSGAYR